jgi:hypothetical protein
MFEGGVSCVSRSFLVFLFFLAPVARADDSVMAFTLDEVAGSLAAGAQDPKPEARAPEPQSEPAPTAAEAADAELAAVMGELRWGMSSKQLVTVLEARVRAEYDRRVRAERDILRQDELYQESQARIAAIKESFVVFDARKNGWDASQIAPEFRRGTHEAMLVVKSEQARDYYFFINGKLWKWYRELEPGARGAVKFDSVATIMQAQLGPAKYEPIQRSEDAPLQASAGWQTSQTRVTLLDRGVAPCLILESQVVLGVLSVLRKDAVERGPKRNTLLDAVIMDDSARERWHKEADGSAAR